MLATAALTNTANLHVCFQCVMRFSSTYCFVELEQQDYCSVELDDKEDQNLMKNIMPQIGQTMSEIKIESIDQYLELRCLNDAKLELD